MVWIFSGPHLQDWDQLRMLFGNLVFPFIFPFWKDWGFEGSVTKSSHLASLHFLLFIKMEYQIWSLKLLFKCVLSCVRQRTGRGKRGRRWKDWKDCYKTFALVQQLGTFDVGIIHLFKLSFELWLKGKVKIKQQSLPKFIPSQSAVTPPPSVLLLASSLSLNCEWRKWYSTNAVE